MPLPQYGRGEEREVVYSVPTHTRLLNTTHRRLTSHGTLNPRTRQMSGSRPSANAVDVRKGTNQRRRLRRAVQGSGPAGAVRQSNTKGLYNHTSYIISQTPPRSTPNPPRSLHWNPLPKGRRPDAELDVACLGRFWLGRAAAWGSRRARARSSSTASRAARTMRQRCGGGRSTVSVISWG